MVAVDADAGEVGVALATCVADDFRLSRWTGGGAGDEVGRTVYRIYLDTALFGRIELAACCRGTGRL